MPNDRELSGSAADEGDGTRRLYVTPSEDYSQFLRRCNWYTFTFAQVEIEDDACTGRWRIDLALLGLHVHIEYIYDFTFTHAMRDRVEELKEGLKARTGATEVVDPFNELAKLGDKKENGNGTT